jgi:ketosteroid isomerase-like protein
MDQLSKNKEFVVHHFEELVNRKNVSVIANNFAPGFLDHEGPDGKPLSVEEGSARMAKLAARFPDLHVDLRDVVAEGDKVVVRGVWTGTDANTGEKMEFHGFVLWRLENGRFAERWATATNPAPLPAHGLAW